jgi:hypothetical protein
MSDETDPITIDGSHLRQELDKIIAAGPTPVYPQLSCSFPTCSPGSLQYFWARDEAKEHIKKVAPEGSCEYQRLLDEFSARIWPEWRKAGWEFRAFLDNA